MSIPARILTIIGCAALGAVFGVVGTVAHASLVPFGLVIAVLAAASLVLGVRLLIDRWAAVAAAVGLVAAIVIFSGPGPGGSVIAPSGDPFALAWAIAAPLLAAVIVAYPSLPQKRDAVPVAETAPAVQTPPAASTIAAPTTAAPTSAPTTTPPAAAHERSGFRLEP